MMRNTLFVVIFLAVFSSFGQICKYEVDQKDPLTDDIIRTVKTRITSPRPFYFFYYIRNGEEYKFKVEVADYGELDNTITKGSELILRAGNGKVIRMKAIESAEPEIIKEFSDVLTKYEITYQTTPGAMRAIAASGVVFIRIADLKNTFSDMEIPEAVVEISKANGECLFK